MEQVPIVVAGYNRPQALQRLLRSLLKASYPGPVKLYISIDGGGSPESLRIAHDFQWTFGEKVVMAHPENLGLKNHILSCASLAERHRGIILLEDDLFVSPLFYEYTIRALDFYGGHDRIGGISLYGHGYNETAQFPFFPVVDESDVFFMQYPSSWGQCWTRKQWSDFKEWYAKWDPAAGKATLLPPNVRLWPASSWKKIFLRYLIEHNKYFVYPRTSLTTNFADAGQHMSRKEQFLQRPLLLASKEYRFKEIDSSFAVYDSYGEILPDRLARLNPDLQPYDFETDLYGMKNPYETDKPYMLTSSNCRHGLLEFGRELKPQEANIIGKIPGNVFHLAATNTVSFPGYFRKLMKCSSRKALNYHYSLRLYHHQWSKIILMIGNLLYHPRVFPFIRKFR